LTGRLDARLTGGLDARLHGRLTERLERRLTERLEGRLAERVIAARLSLLLARVREVGNQSPARRGGAAD
jgi:hypothetical protein